MYDIALIGGAGYVGGAIISHFSSLGAKLLVIDNFIYNHRVTYSGFLNSPNVDFIDLNFAKHPNSVVSQLKNCKSTVILGGLVGDPITKKFPKLSEAINKVGIENLLRKIDTQLNDKRIVFISTCSNYGLMSEGILADENSELKPLSLYAEAKVNAEELILNKLSNHRNNTYTILRFATAFGISPRMRFDLTVNQFTRSLALKQKLIVFDADTWRPYCHVNDFARLIERVHNAPKSLISCEVFNAGSDTNNHTKRSLINEIQKVVSGGQVVYQENGNDPRNYRVNFTKVRLALEFTPAFSLSDGIIEIQEAIKNGFFLNGVKENNLYGNYDVE